MALKQDEIALINECIDSHQRLIEHHRQQILNLKRKLADNQLSEIDPLKAEIKK